MASRYPQALEFRSAGPGDAGECSICTNSLTDAQETPAVCVECNAAFHGPCLNPWIRIQETAGEPVTCPICRRGYGEPAVQEVSPSELASQIRAQELQEANATAARMTRLEENVQDLHGWVASIKCALDHCHYSEPRPRTPPPPTGRLARLEEEVQGLRVWVTSLSPFPIPDPETRTPLTAPVAHLTRLEEDISQLHRRVEALRRFREPPPRPPPRPPPIAGFSAVSTGITNTTLPLPQQGSDSWSLPSWTGSRASSPCFDDGHPASPHDFVDTHVRRRPASYLRRRPTSSHARRSNSSDDSSDDERTRLRLHVHRQGQLHLSHSNRRPRLERREPGRSNGGSEFLRRFLDFAAGSPFSTREVRIRRDTTHGGHFERMPRR